MQLNVALLTAAVLSASGAMAATVTGFASANCTGTSTQVFNVQAPICFTFESDAPKSIKYSGVPKSIQFFVPGGSHDLCTSPQLTLGAGSECATAPPGFSWLSVAIN